MFALWNPLAREDVKQPVPLQDRPACLLDPDGDIAIVDRLVKQDGHITANRRMSADAVEFEASRPCLECFC